MNSIDDRVNLDVSTPPGSRRLFFALWPTSIEQTRIYDLTRAEVLASGGREIPARNLHVTLAFLGQVPEARLGEVAALADRVGRCGRIDLSFERVEVWKRSGVLVLVPEGVPSALTQFADGLKFNLLKEQFEVGHEEYRPHLTLARDAQHRIARDLVVPIRWSAERFTLVESKTRSGGSIYTSLHNWELIQ
jgi:2'-5' RNA ligase